MNQGEFLEAEESNSLGLDNDFKLTISILENRLNYIVRNNDFGTSNIEKRTPFQSAMDTSVDIGFLQGLQKAKNVSDEEMKKYLRSIRGD